MSSLPRRGVCRSSPLGMAGRLSMLRPAFPVPTWMVGKPRLDARGGLSAALQAGCNHASATPMSQLAEQPHRNICGARNSLCNNRKVGQKFGNCNAVITRDIIATVLRYIHQKPTMQFAIGQLFCKNNRSWPIPLQLCRGEAST